MEPLQLRSPMLAPNKQPNIAKLKYPMYASIKMDGIRCLVMNGKLISRSGKEIPNRSLRERLYSMTDWCGYLGRILDGELWSPTLTFQEIVSSVMSQDKPCDPTIKLWAFDCLWSEEWRNHTSQPYTIRDGRLLNVAKLSNMMTGVIRVEQTIVNNVDELTKEYELALNEKHEGLIVRDMRGKYKWGRCTIREHNMFKIKPFDELDCIITNVECLYRMADGTERQYDEFGRPKPVHTKDDRIETDMLGCLFVMDEAGRRFSVGTGFSNQQRRELWQKRNDLIGQWCKVKSMTTGVKILPRHPVFVGFRDSK